MTWLIQTFGAMNFQKKTCITLYSGNKYWLMKMNKKNYTHECLEECRYEMKMTLN